MRPKQYRYWRWEDYDYTFKGDHWWAATQDRELSKATAADLSSWTSKKRSRHIDEEFFPIPEEFPN